MQKILAIDDKMDNLITLSALLKNLMPDCAVITAQSGRGGIEKARAELPDAILLDVKMPDMDGFETCRRLKSGERTRHIPVIMITAIRTDPQSRIKGLEIGADAFLAKPIDEYELVSQVRVALRIKNAEDALREEKDSLERKVQERTVALRESEKLFRSLFENMLNGFAYCQMHFDDNDRPCDFTYLSVNRAFETLTGLRNVAGEKVSYVIPGIRATDGELLEIYGRVSRTGNPERFEIFVQALEMWFSVSVYSPEKEFFVAVFDVITERKQAEQKLNETLESLRRAVSATIQVMVSAVETRDPYTAGHQVRSSHLASAIAAEMGLSQDQTNGIRFAGSIHDIGKLSIPAEILSKPTKLSEIEFSLIKEHSRRGYEILKDVESPWPLAEIIYQHHERMNGSGYPRNLQGEEICLEARILAVADVVESMASHRPYRAGLGIDAALAEIENNRGILYDQAVVDSCLKLFRQKGFQLDGI